MNNIEKFIKRFRDPEGHIAFPEDCSYWFAMILYRRFIRDGSKIMFDIINRRFGTMLQGMVYDATGDITSNGEWIPWIELQDKGFKQEIINKYIMF